MFFNTLIFTSMSFLVILSTLGYGLVFCNKVFQDSRYLNLPFVGIFGIFFLYIISSITHLVAPHNFLHNILLLTIGILIFINFFKRKLVEKKDFKIIIIIFLCLFLGFLISKTNEDFSYYHLPNSLQFSSNKLEFGLGNLNHGFKHFSSIFLINSIFYFPYTEVYLFNITNFMLQIFFFSGLILLIHKKGLNNFSKALAALSLITFIVKFYRLSEYGADYLGQFLVLLSFIFASLTFSKNNMIAKERKQLFLISMLLVIFATTTKFLYAIYIIIPVTIFIYRYKLKEIFTYLFDRNFLIISSISIFSIILFNFTSTGCLLYPILFTCFTDSIDWSISENAIRYLNLHYKAWSKAGIGTGYGTSNPQEYISGLNWVENWTRMYFFNKVSDYILVVLLVSIIFVIYLNKNFKNSNKLNFNHKISKISYISILVVFLLWFFNFPTLRYAGYSIVFLLFAVPVAIFLSKKLNFKDKKILKKLNTLIILALFIFNIKNIDRINKELSLKSHEHHNFLNFPFFWIDNVEYEKALIKEKFFYEVTNNKPCWNVPSTCIRNKSSIIIEKNNNYYFYKQNEK